MNELKDYKTIYFSSNSDGIVYNAGFFAGFKDVEGNYNKQVTGWVGVQLNSNFISEIINFETKQALVQANVWEEFCVFFGVKKKRALLIEKKYKNKNNAKTKHPELVSYQQTDFNRVMFIRAAILGNAERPERPPLPLIDFYLVNITTKTVVMSNRNQYEIFVELSF